MADLPAAPPAATLSIHRDYLEQASPAWLTDATPSRRAQLKQAAAPVPDWYRNATPTQRQTLHDKTRASFTAQTALDKAMAPVQDIDAFAEPLLVKALSEQFKVDLDVHKTLLVLRKPLEVTLFDIRVGRFEVLRIPLLQAALHNFEEGECTADAFDRTSGFFTLTAAGDHIEPVTTPLTVMQFTSLCRSLDIGAQYQRYLKDFLLPKDSVAEQVLRHKFISARKADLAAAAEAALLSKDIEPADHAMILSMINGERHPWMGDKQVWLRDLGLMKKRMIGCVAFAIVKKYRYGDEVILYIPNDPFHPLKRYNWAQFAAMFKQRFNARDQPDPGDGTPTAYQQFFSQFVAYADLPDYFAGLTEEAPAANFGAALAPYAPLLNSLNKGINPFAGLTGIKELPPIAPRARLPNPDPYLNPGSILIKGRGLWEENPDLWDHLYTRHRDKILNDAAAHAVPTADVDARVRSAKIAALLNAGLMVLNTVSMFVPVLGEVMMTVMAGQLLYETFEGSLEWAEGDRRAAKAHLVDVAENLATLAVMAGVGKVVSSFAAARPAPLIEALDPVTLPNGQVRLGKPDLKGYASPDPLPANIAANARGQYLHAGKSYIRQGDEFYEKTYDSALGRWRIRHPTDPNAYQPVLMDNGVGAWRHTLERPQAWDRLTLMRRLGPLTHGFDDEQLLKIADISATSDGALRQMYLDEAPLPAALADTLRLFKADRDVAQVIEQVSTGKAVDGRYLYVLPLLTDMPRWPMGRVLEVFEGADLAGPVQRYGTERLYHGVERKAPIRISRADVLGSQLPARILAALDESEIVGMLGGEPARVPENRPLELRKQLADFARSRQPALFDSLYKGAELSDPVVAKLQRLYPGLSEHAAQRVLTDADVEQIARLRATGRVPLAMQEHARWQVIQGRLGRAYTGLHMQNLISADSKRLALHTLSKLPGWSDQLRLEVREGTISGALLDDGRYEARDERDQHLHGVDDLYASLQHALPDRHRRALGLPHVGQGAQLKQKIIANALSRESLRAVLNMQTPTRSFFHTPVRVAGKLGYPLTGRGVGTSPVTIESRVRELFPAMSDAALVDYLQGKDLENTAWLFALEVDYKRLGDVLTEWRWANRDYASLRTRRRISSAIKAAWRNSSPHWDYDVRGAYRGQCIELSGEEFGPELATLPVLPGNFNHVTSIRLIDCALTEAGTEFLSTFRKLRALDLSNNALTRLPPVVDELPFLEHLALEDNEIVLTTESVASLRTKRAMEMLSLDGNPLGMPLDISRMGRLKFLMLASCELSQWPTGLFAMHRSREFVLDLSYNPLSQIPEVAPGSERAETLARTAVSHDQVSPEVSAKLKLYMESIGLDPGRVFPPRRSQGSGHWMAGLTPEQWLEKLPVWNAVEEAEGAEPFFNELQKLSTSSDTLEPNYKEQLTAKVWRMLEAMAADTDLREHLFLMALAPTTCVDAGAQLFNAMGVEVLVQEARGILDEPLRTQTLLGLAIGKSRLDELGKIAKARMRELKDAGMPYPIYDEQSLIITQYDAAGEPLATIDEVEIDLAYHTGLATALDLPWQSRTMMFVEPNVTPVQLENAYRHIEALEQGDLLSVQVAQQPFWESYIRDAYAERFRDAERRIGALTDLIVAQEEWQAGSVLSAPHRQALRDTILSAGQVLGKTAEQLAQGQVMSQEQYTAELATLSEVYSQLLVTLTGTMIRRFPSRALAPWAPGLLP